VSVIYTIPPLYGVSYACYKGQHADCHTAIGCQCTCHVSKSAFDSAMGSSPTFNMEDPAKPLCCGREEMCLNPDAVAVRWWKCLECGRIRKEVVKAEVW